MIPVIFVPFLHILEGFAGRHTLPESVHEQRQHCFAAIERHTLRVAVDRLHALVPQGPPETVRGHGQAAQEIDHVIRGPLIHVSGDDITIHGIAAIVPLMTFLAELEAMGIIVRPDLALIRVRGFLLKGISVPVHTAAPILLLDYVVILILGDCVGVIVCCKALSALELYIGVVCLGILLVPLLIFNGIVVIGPSVGKDDHHAIVFDGAGDRLHRHIKALDPVGLPAGQYGGRLCLFISNRGKSGIFIPLFFRGSARREGPRGEHHQVPGGCLSAQGSLGGILGIGFSVHKPDCPRLGLSGGAGAAGNGRDAVDLIIRPEIRRIGVDLPVGGLPEDEVPVAVEAAFHIVRAGGDQAGHVVHHPGKVLDGVCVVRTHQPGCFGKFIFFQGFNGVPDV